MGRERQKRKNRSSRPKVKPKTLGRTKAGKKKVNFLGNETIAQNWDRDLTLEQNYKRLGLSTKLNSSISGPRKIKGKDNLEDIKHDSLGIAANKFQRNSKLQEVRVERDPETGHILSIINGESDEDNPLDDPLNELSDEDTPIMKNGVIAQLEAQAEAEALMEAKKKKPRQQSTRESEWLASLVAKHGNNVGAMFKDKKLNPMQQSEGDISKRLKKWKATQQR